MADAQLVGEEAEQLGAVRVQSGRQGNEEMASDSPADFQRLHCGHSGAVVGIVGRDDANELRIDRQRRLLGRHEGFQPIVGNHRVGRIAEQPDEIGVVRIAHRLRQFQPQEAAARLGLRIGIIALVFGQRDPGGDDARNLAWRRRHRQRQRPARAAASAGAGASLKRGTIE